jgi:hypothetical protein
MTTVDRISTPFLIVTFHRPMYCSDDMNCDERADKLKKEAEDIFYKNTVLEKMESLKNLNENSEEYKNLYQDIISVGEYKIDNIIKSFT